MYRSVDQRREFGVRDGPFTGGHVIDVERLSARDRAKLAERLRSSAPILAARERDATPWAASTLLLAIAALVALALCQFGELGEPMAMQSEWPWPLLYATIGAIAAASAARLAVALRFAGWQPLPQGTFLFPLDLLVVTGRRIHVSPFGDVRVADIDEKACSVLLTYADGRAVTVSGERASKASLLSELLAAQRSLEDATLAGSSSVDVLASIRSAGWDTVEARGAPPGVASSPKVVQLARFGIVGAGVALALWDERETRSDDAIFYQGARGSNRSEDYLHYLAQGTRHEADARQRFLPAALRAEAGTSIVLLDRFVRAPFPSTEVDLATSSLHWACQEYARTNAPASPPTEFGADGVVIPRMVATCGTGGWRPPDARVPAVSGDRSEQEICASELDRARLDDVLLLQEPIRLWDYAHAAIDPQRVAEARGAAGTAMDALVAAIRANAADPEARAELVALLEVARAAERPAVVFVEDRTTLPPSHFNLSLRGALRFAFSPSAGAGAPDATWTFTKSGRLNVNVVMARGKVRIERSFSLDRKDHTVMRAFLDHVVGWPIGAPAASHHAQLRP